MFKPLKEKHRDLITAKLAPYLADPDCPMWVLSKQNFQNADLPRILSKLEYIQVETLISTDNNRPPIIAEIAVVPWVNLRVLNLSFNNIASLEPISHLSATQLVSLFLDFNCIVSLKGLRKSNFPILKHASLQSNRIRQIEGLLGCSFPKLSYLNLKGNTEVVGMEGLVKQNFDIEAKQLDLSFVIKAHRLKVMGVYGKRTRQMHRLPEG